MANNNTGAQFYNFDGEVSTDTADTTTTTKATSTERTSPVRRTAERGRARTATTTKTGAVTSPVPIPQTQHQVLHVQHLTVRDLQKQGYETRPVDMAILISLTAPDSKERCAIIAGVPGVGKTMFARAVHAAQNEKFREQGLPADSCHFLELQFHAWTSNEELFAAVDVASVVLGAEERHEVYTKGVLWQAALYSKRGPVVLLLDEIDKCMERSENLLLAFLADGVVQGTDIDSNGKLVTANLDNIVTVITTNSTRDLQEATFRRGERYTMGFLAPNVEQAVLRRLTGAPSKAISAVVKAANVIRKSGTSSPSLKEMERLLTRVKWADDAVTIAYLVTANLCKSDADMSPDDVASLAQILHTNRQSLPKGEQGMGETFPASDSAATESAEQESEEVAQEESK